MSKAEFPHESFKAAVEESRIEITEAIAARDKWWIEQMPIMWTKCWTNTCLYMTPDCDFLNDACMAWEQLKREVGQ